MLASYDYENKIIGIKSLLLLGFFALILALQV